MFSDIAGVRAALKERIAPLLVEQWDIQQNLKDAPTEFRAPLLTFEFTRLDSTVNGQALGPGQAAAGIDLILSSPKSTEDGEDQVDDLALVLVQIIDAQSDIFWSSAEKQRLPGNQWAWRVHTTVLTESKEQ